MAASASVYSSDRRTHRVVRVNPGERGDVSNRTKAAEDFLVSMGITLDDRHNWAATATKDPSVPRGFCIVQITKEEADAA
jgi:hypothetical protein